MGQVAVFIQKLLTLVKVDVEETVEHESGTVSDENRQLEKIISADGAYFGSDDSPLCLIEAPFQCFTFLIAVQASKAVATASFDVSDP